MAACVAGHRADILMRKTALCIASLKEKKTVTPEDVDEAAELVLFHRTRVISPPSQPEHEEKEKTGGVPPEGEKEQQKEKSEGEDAKSGQTGDGEAAGEAEGVQEPEGGVSNRPGHETVLPVGDVFTVKRIQIDNDRKLRKGSGRRTRARTSSKGGRYGGKPLAEAMEAAEEIGDDPRVKSVVVDVEGPGLISFGFARRLSAKIQ